MNFEWEEIKYKIFIEILIDLIRWLELCFSKNVNDSYYQGLGSVFQLRHIGESC